MTSPSPSASYELLPSDVDAANSPSAAPVRRSKKNWKNSALLLVAFLIVAAASFALGRWSARSPSSGKDIDENPASGGKETPEKLPVSSPPAEDSPEMSAKHSVGYFVNWGIYGRKYPPSSIPVNDLTHILYAFANIKPDSGEVFLSDAWADQDIHYPGDSWNEPSGNLYGNFKQIYLLKKQNRHLKVLLSIGGWTYSPSFHPVVVSSSHRARFVESSIKLLEDYGLDGIDVDYEYPQNSEQAQGYVDLLRELRHGLDDHARNKGANYRFLLTIAAPCGPDNYQKLRVREMDTSLDLWNLMSYDFSGSWDSVAGHQANLYGGPINADQAISWYINQGVNPAKVIMGIPLYGRSFASTQGPGQPFSGVGRGSWENGVLDYRTLPLPDAYVFRDAQLGASWTLDYGRQEMVSFDDAEVGRWKGAYIRHKGLGGSMFWELSGDKGAPHEGMEGGLEKEERPGENLVRVVKDAMGGLNLSSQNWLQYEGSKFPNMREGM